VSTRKNEMDRVFISVPILTILALGLIYFGTAKSVVTDSDDPGSPVPPVDGVPRIQVAKRGESTPTPPPSPIKSNDEKPILGEFAFQHAETGLVPGEDMAMTNRKAGELSFKFVSASDTNSYNILRGGKFLSLNDVYDGILQWTSSDPGLLGAWVIKSGYCGDVASDQSYTNEFIMVQNVISGNFLTVKSNKLTCEGTPTNRTRASYCWRQVWNEPTMQKCGMQEYDGRLINIPCKINDNPSEGCASATPGFKSDCCGKNPHDVTCVGNYWREVVGRSVDDSILYLKTKYPHMRIRKCESGTACTQLKPFPIYDENLIVVTYDPRTGVVTEPARRWI
jgi:hypothetical protein